MKKSIPIWMAWHRARTTAWPHRPIRRSVRLPRELMMRDTDASKAAARERSVQMLRTAFGPAIIEALDDPDIGEVMLNPDGRIWVDRLRSGREQIGRAACRERVCQYV